MFIEILNKKKISGYLLPCILLVTVILCLLHPEALSNGVSRGLAVCSGVIIPTLYPFMILAGFVTESPLCRQPGKWMCSMTRRLFGLPGCCGPAIFLSIVGGYPSGAMAIGQLRKQGSLTQEQAKRMTLFCINAGPGFIVSTVGNGLLGSTSAGILLFAAHICTSLLMGIFLGKGHRKEKTSPMLPATAPRPVAHIVADTCNALLTMCGFVLLASAALSLAESFGMALTLQKIMGIRATHISAALAAILEVSCGCIAIAGSQEWVPFFLCLCMGWGGLSVQGQLAAVLEDKGFINSQFWMARLFHGTLSGIIAMLLFYIFPIYSNHSLSVLNPGTTSLPHSVTAGASIMLLGLSFFAMLCFSPKNTGKTE